MVIPTLGIVKTKNIKIA